MEDVNIHGRNRIELFYRRQLADEWKHDMFM